MYKSIGRGYQTGGMEARTTRRADTAAAIFAYTLVVGGFLWFFSVYFSTHQF